MNRGKNINRRLVPLLAAALILLPAGALYISQKPLPVNIDIAPPGLSPVEKIPPEQRNVYDLILLGAREEVNRKTRYDATYQAISYPGGDLNPGRGACTDVVIRALRLAGYDLQQLIHEDMCKNFDLYPQLWGLSGPDPNIDHRRTQNQIIFFKRFGESLTLDVSKTDLSQWKHGDFVYWQLPGGQQHTGVISDRTGTRGFPLVIHNNSVAREEDCLRRWKIIGHYRFPGQQKVEQGEW